MTLGGLSDLGEGGAGDVGEHEGGLRRGAGEGFAGELDVVGVGVGVDTDDDEGGEDVGPGQRIGFADDACAQAEGSGGLGGLRHGGRFLRMSDGFC